MFINGLRQKVYNWAHSPVRVLTTVLALIPVIVLVAYIETYHSPFPYGDTTSFSAPTALATKTGTLTFDLLFAIANGHRIFFTRLLTVLLTLFTNWNLELEFVANFILGITNLVIIQALFVRFYPRQAHWFLVACSALMLSLAQSPNWIIGIHTAWHFVLMFLLLALLVLCYARIGWKALFSAAIFALCSTFSFGLGVLSWPILFIAMFLLGYRRWSYYIFWLVVSAITIALYFNNSGIGLSPSTSGQAANLMTPAIIDIIRFVVPFLGGPLAINDIRIATVIGGVGAISFLITLMIIWKYQRSFKQLTPWLVLALYAVGSGVLISLGRLNYYGVNTPITQRYLHPATCLWVALAAMIVLVITQVLPKLQSGRFKVLVAGFYSLLSIGFIALYLLTVMNGASRIEYGETASSISESGRCSAAYIFTRDESCLRMTLGYRLDQLALYNLAGYAALPDQNILLAGDQLETPVVIATNSNWLNYHIADRLLAGVSEDAIFVFLPQSNSDGIDTSSFIQPAQSFHPRIHLVPYNLAGEAPDIPVQLQNASRVWVIRQSQPTTEPLSLPFLGTNAPVSTAAVGYNLSIEEYILLPG